MHDPLLAALDAFAGDHEGEIGRPEAVRRALTDHLRAKGYLSSGSPEEIPAASQSAAATDRYADADPNEAVIVTGVGPMILHRAVRKRVDWREHHGLGLVNVFRGADKQPSVFDMVDLGRLADMERFR
ncbi:hypothetical protein [Lichenibacterium dinghuense]|uniref:hypothetical protein n=1 Tax=Lichenibacterium dinghuense TaxID=2895977 RepID=UPI001F2D3363|nr:hypothetical protein [Lichenibacterium sp. 6Y81]